MNRKALGRPGARPHWQARGGGHDIPREAGRAGYLESMLVLGMLTLLAVALGLAVGIPVAMMLHDMCLSIGC